MLISLIVLLLATAGLLALPGVQTYLAQKAMGYLKSEFNIDASIGRVHIKLPNSISLREVYIADDHADTLIYAEDLRLTYNGFDKVSNTLKSSGITLNNGRLYMRKHPQDSLFNFGIFLEKLSSGEPSDPNATPFRLKVSYIDIANFRFTKERIGCTDTCTNIFLREVEMQVANLFLDGDYVTADVLHFAFLDKDRFRLHDLRGKAAYQPKYIAVNELYFKTDSSLVKGDVVLNYESPDQIEDFLETVDIEGRFDQSTFSSNEFRSYIPEFPQFDIFKISGTFDGPVNDFKLEDCIITIGKNTHFSGRAHIKDPTESAYLRIDARASDLRTTPTELRRYLTQFTGEMEWMTMLDQFAGIAYKGSYKGSINDFDLKGTLTLDENVVTVDGSMTNFDQLEKTTYEGTIAAQPLNAGKLFNIPELGLTSFSAQVNGSGLTTASLNANIQGNFAFIDALGYRYTNLQVNGHVENRNFKGIAGLRDQNIRLDFDGALDFSQDTVHTDFCVQVEDANLKKLGFLNDSIAVIGFESDVAFDFYENSWWSGNIGLSDITFMRANRFYFYDSLQITSQNNKNIHTDVLRSKIANARLSGTYKTMDVYRAFLAEYEGFNRLIPEVQVRPMANFDYELNLNNLELVTDLFLPDLYIEPGTTIKGSYRGLQNTFNLNLKSRQLRWQNLSFDFVSADILHDSLRSVRTSIGSFALGKQPIDSIKLSATMQSDSVWFGTSGIFRDSIDAHFRLAGHVIDSSTVADKRFFMKLDGGRFNIGDNFFDITPNNSILITPEEMSFTNVGFFDESSAIAINGYLTNDPMKILRLSATNLNADLLNYFIRYPGIQLGGRIHGEVIMNRENKLPKFASDLAIDSLFLNDDFLGDLLLLSNWDIESSKVLVDATLKRGSRNTLNATGTYAADSTGLVDMTVTFDRFRLMWVDPFVEGVLSKVRGTLSGHVDLTGTLSNLNTNGLLMLTQGGVGVPYFNTDYNLAPETRIEVTNGLLNIPVTTITDAIEGTKGTFRGSVTHKNFGDWVFDLHMAANKLLVLNTENTADADFYGKGYASGKAAITGTIDDMDIVVDITSEKGTDFKIPFSNPLNIGTQDFITYTGLGNYEYVKIDTAALNDQERRSIGGLDVIINAKITPDAQVQLVMDETVGDIITGRGTGDLRILIPHNADMEMFGTVEIASGEYLFTMRNLINKKFSIIPGGTIKWTSSPYDAIIDMKAKYTTRTTLTGFVTNNYDGQRVQVDLLMDLKGIVMNPNINFEITLPNSNPSYQDELNNRLNDPDKLNQQAFSLLVINSFWSESVNTENSFVSQGVSSNTMQMAAAQFTNFIGQGLGNLVDISVGYNTATSAELSDEVEVGLSKNLLDDRITVNSKIDVPVGTNSSNQNFTGDIEVVYKITTDGRIRAKAFNRSNQDNPTLDKLAPYTQGVGIFYQTSFNTYHEFWNKIFSRKPEPQPVTKADD